MKLPFPWLIVLLTISCHSKPNDQGDPSSPIQPTDSQQATLQAPTDEGQHDTWVNEPYGLIPSFIDDNGDGLLDFKLTGKWS